MGSLFSKVFATLLGKQECNILMLGLDAAGKTTILYKLKLGQVVTTIPTIGWNVETLEYKNSITFICWDSGGRGKIRPLYRHYYKQTNALIWVVDSNDKERIDDTNGYDNTVKEELFETINEEELKDVPLLIFANKQDLPNAMSVKEITERLGLNQLRNRKWYIQATCATSGDGLYEGLDWLSNTLNKK